MEKTTLVTILLALLLTACGSQASPASSNESLPAATLLLVGTFKLEETDNAVTAEQAADLLPLWQVYSELLTSDTAAQEEIEGLVEQIQETMTDEQMQAIEGMNLTQRDVFALMQANGAGMNRASQSSSSGSQSSASGFGPPDGGMPMGAPPDGSGGMPGGIPMGNRSTGASDGTTADAGQGLAGGMGGLSTTLIEALIKLLESKVGL
jgi:hypothetical protein